MRKTILLAIAIALVFVCNTKSYAQDADWLDTATIANSAVRSLVRLDPFAAVDTVLHIFRARRNAITRQEIGELKRVVSELKQSYSEIPVMKYRIESIERQLGEKADKKEVERLFSQLESEMKTVRKDIEEIRDRLRLLEGRVNKVEVSITKVEGEVIKVDVRLTDVEGKVRTLEQHLERQGQQIQQLNQQVGVVKGQLAHQEGCLDSHIQKTGQQMGSIKGQLAHHEGRLDAHEKTLKDHERRISELERKVELFGLDAYDHYRAGKFDQALAKIDDGLENDPGNTSLYYLKAFTLKAKGTPDAAKKAVRMGIAAEKLRAPAQWYGVILERCQGVDRQWFEEARNSFRPVSAR